MSVVSGDERGVRLRHSLAMAADLWRDCIINEVPVMHAARQMGLDREQAEGSVRLLRSLPQLPSVERLALVVMNDPGLDDADVAEMFGRSERWARMVRATADELRESEPINPKLEWLEDGLQATHPKPEEIQSQAMAIRSGWDDKRFGRRPTVGDIRHYSWTGDRFATLPTST